MLNDATLWSLRQQAAESGDCELSRTCSAALWGAGKDRANARRRIGRLLARKAAS